MTQNFDRYDNRPPATPDVRKSFDRYRWQTQEVFPNIRKPEAQTSPASPSETTQNPSSPKSDNSDRYTKATRDLVEGRAFAR